VYQCSEGTHFNALNLTLSIWAPLPNCSSDAFETHALRTLSGGGSFPSFCPSTNQHTTLQLAPSERNFFYDVAGLQSAAAVAAASGSAVTFIPKAKNFPAIDAVLPDNILLNATLDESRELLLQGERVSSGVAPLAQALGIRSPVKFVWALPHDHFEDFCREGKPAVLVGAALRGLRVEQCFLRVPPPPWAPVGAGKASPAQGT
jgi:hypothetical protein